jgi:nucleoside-diphosphate-sugar epimerase
MPATWSSEGEERIEGRRVAVTGAGGFIGEAVTRRLVDEGADVIGIEVAPELGRRVQKAGAVARLADVSDRETIATALRDAELVVHAAAYVREWGPMEDFMRVNVEGTANVLDGAEAAGAARVVHLSSVVVYGFDDEGEQDESAHRRAVGIPYIDTKSASDRIACRRGAVVIRPGDVYGPGSVPWVLRPGELLRRGQMALPGRGDGNMLPVYIDDLVESIVLGLHRGVPGHAYTVWSGEEITFDDYATRLAEASGGKPPRHLPKPVLWTLSGAAELAARARGVPPPFGRHGVTLVDRRGSVSNRRAREELGWEAKVDLEEGIRHSAKWLRSQAAGT